MKKLLFTILCISFFVKPSIAYSQNFICERFGYVCEEINYEDLIIREMIYYKKFSDKPFTGFANGKCCKRKLEDYEKLKIKKDFEYKLIKGKILKGKRDGEWLKFNEDGSLLEKISYKFGKLDGKYE